MFEKYAAPILNLAGMKVSVVKTEHEGQARALMEVMDNTDAVIIAGGDGTVLEAVTGLLRREDSETAVKRYPIGIIPIGKHNSLTGNLFSSFLSNEAKYMAECAISIVRDSRRNVDVMRISSDEGKEIYAVSNIEWSAYRDTSARTSKFWMFGPLKSKVLYLSASLTKWPFSKEGSISFTPPCDGCSKCFVKPLEEEVKTPRRWWAAFVPRSQTRSLSDVEQIDYSKIENEACGKLTTFEFGTTDLEINVNKNYIGDDIKSLDIKIAPKDISRSDFIKEGWRRASNESKESSIECNKMEKAKTVRLIPQGDTDNEWFSIDSEAFEAKQIEIEFLPQKVQIFCPTRL